MLDLSIADDEQLQMSAPVNFSDHPMSIQAVDAHSYLSRLQRNAPANLTLSPKALKAAADLHCNVGGVPTPSTVTPSDSDWSDIFGDDEVEDEADADEEGEEHPMCKPTIGSNCAFKRQVSGEWALIDFSEFPLSRQVSTKSCDTCVTMSHIDSWSEPNETLILFDFDDTLYPTTQVCDQPEYEHGEDLDWGSHEAAVSRLLQVAASIGEVQILTMATNSWVEEKIVEVMPALWNRILELQIPIVSARDNVSPRSMREACSDTRDPSQFLKKRAMKQVIRKFYCKDGKRGGRSWKNVVSIGDSEAEQLALQDIVFQHVQRDRKGTWKECRCKTLLLLPHPKLAELTAEIKFVEHLLPAFVQYDGDLHMEIDHDDLEAGMSSNTA